MVRKRTWKHKITDAEKTETDELMSQVEALRMTEGKQVSGLHLISTFIRRRIQPLQARVHGMWMYSGSSDPTRTRGDELSRDELETRIRAITSKRAGDPCDESSPVEPFGEFNAPTKVSQN